MTDPMITELEAENEELRARLDRIQELPSHDQSTMEGQRRREEKQIVKLCKRKKGESWWAWRRRRRYGSEIREYLGDEQYERWRNPGRRVVEDE